MVQLSDAILARRAAAGDRPSLDELVRRHGPRVFALARGIVRHDHDAEDVAQETWIAVVRHIDSFNEAAQFTTWLHRIAVRKAYDLLRRRTPVPVDPTDVAATMLASRDPSPQDTHLDQAALLDALSQLDEAFRTAIVLVDVLGCGVDEAAAVLDVAPGTIKSRVFRGRSQLAALLGTAGIGGASQ